MKYKVLIGIGSLAAIAAGLMHIFYGAFGHSNIFPQMMLFLIGGLLQIALGIFIWFENYIHYVFWLACIVHGGFITLLILALVFPIPFVGTPEALGNIGLIILILQFIALIAFLPIFAQKSHYTFMQILIAVTSVAVLTGTSTFAFGHVIDQTFPQIKMKGQMSGSHHGGGSGGHHH
jgi:hypothetical protein